jgi:hypothetical protein
VTLLAAWPVTSFNGIGRIIDSAKLSIAWPLLTMQRHTSLPDGMGGIGGFGQVTNAVPCVPAFRGYQPTTCSEDLRALRSSG